MEEEDIGYIRYKNLQHQVLKQATIMLIIMGRYGRALLKGGV